MSKILVVGSEGTIGYPLVQKLINDGHDVWCSDIKHKHEIFSQEDKYIRCDISEYRQLYKLLEICHDVDYIYFLAAEFGRHNGEDYYEQCWKSNVIGTKNLIRVLEGMDYDSSIKTVFFSSSEVYGSLTTEDGLLHEDDINKFPIHLVNDYAISKHVNEMQIKNTLQENPHIKLSTVRLFNAYGPNEWYHSYRSVVCLFCYRMLHDLPITLYKDYYRVFMYIDDLINTLSNYTSIDWNTVDRKVINIGGEEYTSVERMYEIIKHNLPNSNSKVNLLEKDSHNTVAKRPDITIAKKLLNHNPSVGLNVGIPKTLEWMKKVYDKRV